jgi:PAP2 superfamily
MQRRTFLAGTASVGALAAFAAASPVLAQVRPSPAEVHAAWYALVLELVRHTPTYTPPVASRAFAYLGVTAFEVEAAQDSGLRTLAGQLNDLTAGPSLPGGGVDPALALHQALAESMVNFFGNTGPMGQRAIVVTRDEMTTGLTAGLDPDLARRSTEFGHAVADHILTWSASDGGAVIENMGFPKSYTPGTTPASWVPTSKIALQQAPLLPGWGKVRTFAMPAGTSCPLPPPPAYSEDPASEFYSQALEVRDTVANMTPDQREIARFWSDDPMLSSTPPGHWITIALQILDRDNAPMDRRAEVLALLGIAVADGFIGCWQSKFEYDLLRPITYIRRVIDPKFEPLLNTPPFPEYPSGHSTQSAAAATVLAAMFGADFAFDDATHEEDGLPARHFANFAQAAEEAGLSRLYGGIHFRAAVERGLEQGRCVGAFAAELKTRK